MNIFDEFNKALDDAAEYSEGKIHYGILCDNCNDLIVGIRYKCLYCDNYDFCEDCEKTGLHANHPLLRLATRFTPTDVINSEQQATNEALANQCIENITSLQKKEAEHQTQISKLLKSHEKILERLNKQHRKEIEILQDTIKGFKNDAQVFDQQRNLIMENILLPQKIFMTYLDEKPLQQIGGRRELEKAIASARREHGLDVENYYNYGFAGHTKTGKSSIINSIRGLKPKDKGAAKVDFTECTQNVTLYSATNEKMKRARFYDIPGCGTLSHETKSYYLDKGLCAFDCLVIMVDKTIGEDEVSLARAAQHYGQGVVFVRSKCDIDLDAKKENEDLDFVSPKQMSEYLDHVRTAISEQIEAKCPDLNRIPCYFISAPTLRQYVLRQEPTYIFQENLFIEYLILKSKHSRNIIV